MSRRPLAALVVAVLALATSGCGSGAASSPPTGVDGLTIPTPSPVPADFVARVDNPWFPLPLGARWSYGLPGQDRTDVARVSAAPGPTVLGVDTTAVRTITRSAGALGRSDVVDLYAQDRAGNVWWFGHRVAGSTDVRDVRDVVDVGWRAGVGGAQAGLAVPAAPRRGDGFRSALQPGRVDQRAEVVSTQAELVVPYGHYAATLVIDTQDAVHDRGVRRVYAAGVGLVEQQTIVGPGNGQLVLVDRSP